MKQLVRMAVLSALVLGMSSCENDTVMNGNDNSSLKIQTDIAQTRGTISGFPAGSALGLFVTSGSLGSHYNSVASNANVQSTYSGSVWAQSPAVYLSNADATVFAYYPYNIAKTDGKAIPVEHGTQTDFMFGTHSTGQTGINNGNPSVRLTMRHALSMVQFKFNRMNYTGPGKLTKVEIANAAGRTTLASEGTMNIASGVITNSVGKHLSASIENSEGLIASIPTTASMDESIYPKVMVLPVATVQVTGDLVIRFTIDGKVYAWNVPAASVWAGGTKNTYSVTLSGTEITVGSIVITDWLPGSTGTAGLQ
jgi:Fimbrillin-like